MKNKAKGIIFLIMMGIVIQLFGVIEIHGETNNTVCPMEFQIQDESINHLNKITKTDTFEFIYMRNITSLEEQLSSYQASKETQTAKEIVDKYLSNIESNGFNLNENNISILNDLDNEIQSLSKNNSRKKVPSSKKPYYELTDEEREAIERMVASEGGYCSYYFQSLVAYTILNGCEAENKRPTELFDRGDYWLTHNVEPTKDTKKAVSDIFDKGIKPVDQKIRYYYNPLICSSPAHETFQYVLTDTDCRFFCDWD